MAARRRGRTRRRLRDLRSRVRRRWDRVSLLRSQRRHSLLSELRLLTHFTRNRLGVSVALTRYAQLPFTVTTNTVLAVVFHTTPSSYVTSVLCWRMYGLPPATGFGTLSYTPTTAGVPFLVAPLAKVI